MENKKILVQEFNKGNLKVEATATITNTISISIVKIGCDHVFGFYGRVWGKEFFKRKLYEDKSGEPHFKLGALKIYLNECIRVS